MARVTIQDCLEKIDNPFTLVRSASHRARNLSMGAASRLAAEDHKPTVIALQEIAEGLVNDEGQLYTAYEDQQQQDNQDEEDKQTEIDRDRMVDEGDTAPASHELETESEDSTQPPEPEEDSDTSGTDNTTDD